MWAFYVVWILSFVHAVRRGLGAWAEQSYTITVLALIAVTLNWITTGDHVLRSLGGGLYGVAGMDLLLLLGGGIAWLSARKLHRRSEVPAAESGRTRPAPDAADIEYG